MPKLVSIETVVKKVLNKTLNSGKLQKSQGMQLLDDFKEQRKFCRSLIHNAKFTFDNVWLVKLRRTVKLYKATNAPKLKTKETDCLIADGDVVMHNDACVANIIHDYLSSVFTNDKLTHRERAMFCGSSNAWLTEISFTKDDVCKQ